MILLQVSSNMSPKYPEGQFSEQDPIESGYRNPVHNVAVSSTPRIGSRHQWGDAVDVKPLNAPSGPMDSTDWTLLRSAAFDAGGGPEFVSFEPFEWDETHLHVDLRKWN